MKTPAWNRTNRETITPLFHVLELAPFLDITDGETTSWRKYSHNPMGMVISDRITEKRCINMAVCDA
jgi:hypothetical protein